MADLKVIVEDVDESVRFPDKPPKQPRPGMAYVSWEAGVLRIYTPNSEWVEVLLIPERLGGS